MLYKSSNARCFQTQNPIVARNQFVRADRICQSQQRKQKLTCLGWPMRLPWISRRGGCRSPGRTGCRRHRGRPTGGKTGGCPGTARPCACCGGVRPCLFRGLGKIMRAIAAEFRRRIWRNRSVCPSPSLSGLISLLITARAKCYEE